jgi:hypothetical protein
VAHRRGTLSVHVEAPLVDSDFRLRLRYEPPVSLEVEDAASGTDPEGDERVSPLWTMIALSAGNGAAEDVFVRLLSSVEETVRALAAAFPYPWYDYGRELVAVRAKIRQASDAALRACDPRALDTARRFHRSARWFVYGALVEDPTGRVGQLATVCPGALLLSAALSHDGHAAQADAILGDVARGRRFKHVLHDAASRWEAVREPADRARELEDLDDTPASRVERHVLLLRRARPMVRPDLLLARPPRFTPEDVPVRADRNAEWFEATTEAVPGVLRSGDAAGGLGAFVSRHHRAFAAHARRHHAPDCEGDGAPSAIARLARVMSEWVRETGRRPDRRSAPQRVLPEVLRWSREEWGGGAPEVKLARLLERVRAAELGEVVAVRGLRRSGGLDPALRALTLPPWPHPGVETGDLRVTPLATVAEVAEEGRRMEHCVASLCPRALAAEVFLFAVRAGAARLTVALTRRTAGGYELEEVRGPRDRRATARELEIVGRWLAIVNERDAAAGLSASPPRDEHERRVVGGGAVDARREEVHRAAVELVNERAERSVDAPERVPVR